MDCACSLLVRDCTGVGELIIILGDLQECSAEKRNNNNNNNNKIDRKWLFNAQSTAKVISGRQQQQQQQQQKQQQHQHQQQH